MIEWLAVFVGGGMGSLARLGMGKLVGVPADGFPWATFLSNVAACLVLGFLAGYASQRGNWHPALKMGLTVGFCGGFSTFSTFSLESMAMIGNGRLGLTALYVIASVAVCFLGLWLGQSLARHMA